MKRNPLVVQAVSVALAGFLGWLNESSGAAIWTNRNDGLWQQGANWSGGLAPHLGLGSTFITNANSKTVTVEAATPVTNLFIIAMTGVLAFALCFLVRHPGKRFLSFVGLCVGYVVFARLLFDHAGQVIPLAGPLSVLAVTSFIVLAYDLAVERPERTN